jgi:hypothetical protein
MTRGASAFLLVLALAASGCTADNPPPLTSGWSDEIAPALPADFDETTGGIEGTVLDDERTPISLADVTLVGAGQTRSDLEGRFSFSHVAPMSHRLVAVHPGYHVASRTLEVHIGELSRTELILAPIAGADDPYEVTLIKSGYIECAIFWNQGNGGYARLDPCSMVNQRQFQSVLNFTFPQQQLMTAFVSETTWTASMPANRELSEGITVSAFNASCAQTGPTCYARNDAVLYNRDDVNGTIYGGPAPLRFVNNISHVNGRLGDSKVETRTLNHCARPGIDCTFYVTHYAYTRSTLGISLTQSQRYQVFFSGFFNGPYSDEFTAIPDG